MTAVASSASLITHRPALRGERHARRLAPTTRLSRRRDGRTLGGPLASYVNAEGRTRELLALPGHAGSVLVLDRDAVTLCDRRLVVHLAADEPRENAELVCRHYLEDVYGHWCRRVRPEDLEIAPFAYDECAASSDFLASDTEVVDTHGNVYRLRALSGERSSSQLRWCRHSSGAEDSERERIGVRNVVAALESYDPVRTITELAIARHRNDPNVIVTRLCAELERLCVSPVVLNRGLREAVLDAVEHRDMSMSEIAMRCGIVKRDCRGKTSGETSWLARRIGIMPEGGEKTITPWVHTDVLAVIARKGLGISPREVELQ